MKNISFEAEEARKRGRLRKTQKEVEDKDINDFHLEPGDAMDRNKMDENDQQELE